MIFGHEAVRDRLIDLPQVSMFIGPQSVGKTTLAYDLLKQRCHKSLIFHINTLSVDAAREMSRYAAVRSQPRGVILQLDRATENGLNATLKLLEEPAAHMTFMLVSSNKTLLTVMSRCQVFWFSLLSSDDVARVLISKFNVHPDMAKRAALMSRGQVRRAQQFLDIDPIKGAVLTVARAIAEKDYELLAKSIQSLDEEKFAMLKVWMREGILYPEIFSTEEFYGIKKRDLEKAYDVILRFSLRPRIACRAALSRILV